MLRLAALLLLLGLTPADGSAATFTRDGLCDAFRLVKRGNDLVVVCPGPADWMTVKNIFAVCKRVVATRVSGGVLVACRND